MRKTKIEVYKNEWWDEWRFRFVAGNGQIVCHGEGYTRKSKCLHAIEVIKKIANEGNIVIE